MALLSQGVFKYFEKELRIYKLDSLVEIMRYHLPGDFRRKPKPKVLGTGYEV